MDSLLQAIQATFVSYYIWKGGVEPTKGYLNTIEFEQLVTATATDPTISPELYSGIWFGGTWYTRWDEVPEGFVRYQGAKARRMWNKQYDLFPPLAPCDPCCADNSCGDELAPPRFFDKWVLENEWQAGTPVVSNEKTKY